MVPNEFDEEEVERVMWMGVACEMLGVATEAAWRGRDLASSVASLGEMGGGQLFSGSGGTKVGSPEGVARGVSSEWSLLTSMLVQLPESLGSIEKGGLAAESLGHLALCNHTTEIKIKKSPAHQRYRLPKCNQHYSKCYNVGNDRQLLRLASISS